MNERKNRIESRFRNVKSENGVYSCKIDASTAERVARYCKKFDINKSKFVADIINEKMDVLEKNMLEQMTMEDLFLMVSKEQLISIIFGDEKRGGHNG